MELRRHVSTLTFTPPNIHRKYASRPMTTDSGPCGARWRRGSSVSGTSSYSSSSPFEEADDDDVVC